MSTIRIVDLGRGPQIEGQRLTVMEVFYYLHRGYDYEFIHRAMPSLSREQFDAVVAHVQDHRDELVEADWRVDEFHRRQLAALRVQGLCHAIDHSVPVEVRAERLKEKLRQRLKEQARKNGNHAAH
jgi:hypothetical protein